VCRAAFVRRHRTLVEAYARGADEQTLHDTRSVTKSLTAITIAAAVQDSLLQWDEPVFDSFSALAPFAHDGPAKRGITVADLLTMSSALDCNDWDDSNPGNEENMYPQREWLRWVLDLPTRSVQRDASGRLPFAYCTAGVFLLGQLLERKAPGGLDAYQARRLFTPLRISRWQWWQPRCGVHRESDERGADPHTLQPATDARTELGFRRAPVGHPRLRPVVAARSCRG